MQRSLNKLERFILKVFYKKGNQIITSDTLSRYCDEEEEKDDYLKKIVMKIHEAYNHRKEIMEKLKDNKIFIPKT